MQRQETLFEQALAYESPAGREAYLREACAGDEPLFQSVQALLRIHDRAGKFLDPESPSPGTPSTLATAAGPAAPSEKPGDRIGRYKLLEKIGEGGCGIVYMAEQEEPVRRRVALKVIRLGMDTETVVARFEAERQALALMDHPNIAKVLDAGATETGRPYFVMELVRGTKITEFCDHNNLSTTQRLDLFMEVCRAIQHAHQKGIIHRDIKPSNVLVTLHDGVPVPKVIDFGIAKATQGRLTDKTVFTAFHQFMGTPAYMSPEQAEMSGLDIDTRSDIYSLGVLLYELLTGKTPFDSKELLEAGLDAMRRTIREQEPQRPSTKLSTMVKGELTSTASRRQTEPPKLIHAVRGDLDWIVMKCLEKDRARRYETANGVARDIERHLSNEPVVACPPSNVYRLRKTVQRHRGAFAAATIILLLLVAGVAVSSWQAIRARRAEREQARLRHQAELLSAQETRMRQEAQASAAQAQASEKIARTEADRTRQVVGFLRDIFTGAAPSQALGRDITVLKEILAKSVAGLGEELTNQPAVEIELRGIIGAVYDDMGLVREEEQVVRRSIELARAHFESNSAPMSAALFQLSLALISLGQVDEATSAARQSVAIRRRLLAAEGIALSSWTNAPGAARPIINPYNILNGKVDPADIVEPADLYNSLSILGRCLYFDHRCEAEPAFREALVWARKTCGEEHRDVVTQFSGLGNTLVQQGRGAEAEMAFAEALTRSYRLYGGKAHPQIATDLNNLATALKGEGRFAEAESLARQSLDMSLQLNMDPHGVAISLHNVGSMVQMQNRFAEAEGLNRAAIELATSLGDASGLLSEALPGLAVALRDQGKLDEARKAASEAVAVREKLFGQGKPRSLFPLTILATILQRQGQAAQADSLYRHIISLLEQTNPDGWFVFHARSLLGESLLAQKRYAEAEPLLINGYEGIQERMVTISTGEGKIRRREALQRIVQFYETTNHPEQAAEWKEKLAQFDKATQ